jgi:hypothetical protein
MISENCKQIEERHACRRDIGGMARHKCQSVHFGCRCQQSIDWRQRRSLAYVRSKNGVATLAYGRSNNGVAAPVVARCSMAATATIGAVTLPTVLAAS